MRNIGTGTGSHLGVVIMAGLVACLLAAPDCALAQCSRDNPATSLSVNGHVLTVEIATTPASLKCGLAFREDLPPNHGMLFVFETEHPVRFWMKDTRIPLSIAFLDSEGTIVRLADMDPADPERIYPSGVPVRYALETNRGWFAARAIHTGDRALFTLPRALPHNPETPEM